MTAADLRFYIAIFSRWLPAALLFACLTTAIGGLVAVELPSIYTSTATIVVEVPDLPTQLARSSVPQNALAQVQLIREQLQTDKALTAMAKTLNLAPHANEISDEFIDTMRDSTQIDQIQFGSGDQVIHAFTVSFSASTRDTAALVANKFAEQILADDLDQRQQRAAETLAFFKDDVASLEPQLQTSEARLLAFRNENIAALPESLEFRRGQIADGQASLLDLQAEEASARSRRAGLLAAARLSGRADDGRQTIEAGMLAELKTALAAQMAIFTASSPSVVSLRARIDTLETAVPAPAGGEGASSMPTGEIGVIDNRLAEIASEKSGLEQSRTALEASLLATPANETRLRTMELERDNIQSQYTAAVGRLAEAGAGERVETLLKGERLSLFQEALPPEYPESPQRRLIVALSAFGGFALVAAMAVASEFMNSKIRRPVDLKRRLSIQPLGTVPRFKPEKRRLHWFFRQSSRRVVTA